MLNRILLNDGQPCAICGLHLLKKNAVEIYKIGESGEMHYSHRDCYFRTINIFIRYDSKHNDKLLAR